MVEVKGKNASELNRAKRKKAKEEQQQKMIIN
jgi:hypothetical protein